MRWIMIFAALGLSAPSTVQAEPIAPCQTNTGLDGILYGGMFGTLRAPSAFTAITISDLNAEGTVDGARGNGDLTVFASIALDLDVVAHTAPLSQPRQALVGFADGASNTTSSCVVTIIPFDPNFHDLAVTAFGACDFNVNGGVTELRADATQVLDLPEKVYETASAPTAIAQALPMMGALQIEVTGVSTGISTMLWSGKDTGNGTLKGICPIIVTE